jgi:hypothetical protein
MALPRSISLLLAMSLMGSLTAQDLEQVGHKGGVSLTGGLSAFGALYTTDLGDPRMAPFSWGLSGRLNLSIYDVQLPFSFIFSEKERDFRQPFNQFGVSPRYKWITAHIGHRTMQMSELTMSGQRFLGGGLELTPGRFRFSAMHGRLRREIFADTTQGAVVEPTLERWASAARFGYGTQASHVDLVLFSAADRYDAASVASRAFGDVLPEENLVLGIAGALQLGKAVQVQVDAAGSLHNVGIKPATREGGGNEVSNNFDTFLFNLDQSTRRGTALKTGLSYNLRGFTISGHYERIDPLFQTLGNYFFLRDVENIRGSLGTGLFKQKVRLSASLGLQRNNLSEALSTSTRRTIGSASLSYNSGKVATVSLNWSNFEADVRTAFDAAGTDTLTLRQVSDNITLNTNLRFRNTTTGSTRSLDIAVGYQGFTNEGYPSQPVTTTATYTASLGYRSNMKKKALSWGARLTMSVFESAGLARTRNGLSLNARKGFNRDRTGLSGRVAYYLNRTEAFGGSSSLVANTGLDQRIAGTHRLGFSINFNGRSSTPRLENSQYQLRVQATYSVEFRKREKTPNTP